MRKIICAALIFVFAALEILGLNAAKGNYFARKTQESAENLYSIIVNQSAEIRSGNINNALASEAKLKDEIAKFKKYSGNNDMAAKLEKYYDFVQSARAMEIAEFNKIIKDLNPTLTSDTDFKEKYRSLSDIAENLNLESSEELKGLVKKLSSAMRSASHCKDRCGPGEFAKLQQEYTEAKDNLLALVEQMNNNILNDTQTNSLIEELKKLEK